MQKFKLNIVNPTLDCIDISHHSGSNPKAGIIRFNIDGPDKKFYLYKMKASHYFRYCFSSPFRYI